MNIDISKKTSVLLQHRFQFFRAIHVWQLGFEVKQFDKFFYLIGRLQKNVANVVSPAIAS